MATSFVVIDGPSYNSLAAPRGADKLGAKKMPGKRPAFFFLLLAEISA
jgi:hypothetical protein